VLRARGHPSRHHGHPHEPDADRPDEEEQNTTPAWTDIHESSAAATRLVTTQHQRTRERKKGKGKENKARLNLCRPPVPPATPGALARHGRGGEQRLPTAGWLRHKSIYSPPYTDTEKATLAAIDWANPSLTSSMAAGSPYRDLCCYGAGIAG
jgi:hypothetical protein